MKKMGRIIAALCCLLGLTFPMDRKADAAAAGTIIGTEVRMRKGAGTDTEILGYFEDGEKVEVLKSNVNEGRKWYEVSRKDGTLGWVAGEYCRVQEGHGGAQGYALDIAGWQENTAGYRKGP